MTGDADPAGPAADPVGPGADLAGLSTEPIAAGDLLTSVHPGAGAVVTFEGRVREINQGRRVVRLHYDAYPEMADRVFADILRRVRLAHPVALIRVLHRTGTLVVGETAVAVAVAAGHRAEAFAAARLVIEAVKEELPVWKREEYEDGSSRWLGAKPPAGEAVRDDARGGAG